MLERKTTTRTSEFTKRGIYGVKNCYFKLLKMFREQNKELMKSKDKPAVREAWCAFIDSCARDNVISKKIADKLDNPF